MVLGTERFVDPFDLPERKGDRQMPEDDLVALATLVAQLLGPWDKVVWRDGSVIVQLPFGTRLPCEHRVEMPTRCWDINGFEAVTEANMNPVFVGEESYRVIVYQDGRVVHKLCGKTIAWIVPPSIPTR